ncbi:MAG: hypothetical protein A3H31_03745 [Gallionellales bacterium RIFCSPLOWO2_02_FULL_57_47]|nr:MAG: hypothetical protein A3H31_03745 [Gallionellales bacterium RIFCSPLOWO2_02_FULL_57_47]OGT07928.1 MAG: hypothetical protein A3J49_14765 [Gallionellales bacterium RIFCSPHIGHO2_02_FULL_57_16]
MNSTLKIGLYACALTAAMHANAGELGRLFLTPEQRTQLDYNYARDTRPDSSNNSAPTANARALTLNGIVQMHGGKRTAWINGVPQAVGRSDEKTPESLQVPLPGQNKSVKLKVGQRVLLSPSAGPDKSEAKPSKPDTAKQDAAEED